jgi:hypothetical protein
MLVQIHEVAQQPKNKERGVEIGGMVLVNEETGDVETVITKGEPGRMGTVIDEDNVLGLGHGAKVGKSLALAMVAAEHGWSVKGMAHSHPGEARIMWHDQRAPLRIQGLRPGNVTLRSFVVGGDGAVARFVPASAEYEKTYTGVGSLEELLQR